MSLASHILLPTDFSAGSLKAFDAAVAIAKPSGAKVTLLHVFDVNALIPPLVLDPEAYRRRLDSEVRGAMTSRLQDLRSSLLGELTDVDVRLVEGEVPYKAIVDSAQEVGADLIVLSTHGRTGLSGMLIGSVTEKVVRHASTPVLVIRA